MIKARSWREGQLAAAPNNLRAVISDLPSSRVARVADLMNFVHSWTPHLAQALGHFGSLQHRNMTKKVSATFVIQRIAAEEQACIMELSC